MFNPDPCPGTATGGFTLSQLTVELKGSWCYGACLAAVHLVTCLAMFYYHHRGLISLELAIALSGAVLISMITLLRSEVLRSAPEAITALRFEQGQWKLRLTTGQWLAVELLDPVFINAVFIKAVFINAVFTNTVSTNKGVTTLRFRDRAGIYPLLLARDETSDDSYRHLQVLLRFGLNQKSAV